MPGQNTRLRPLVKITGIPQVKGSLAKKVSEIRQQVLGSMADTMDKIRKDSIKNIVPNRAPLAVSYKQLLKLQPGTPGKLTSRTGRLVEMLKRQAKGGWSKGPRVWQNNSSGIQTRASVLTAGTSIDEAYVGTIAVNAQPESFNYRPFSRFRDKDQFVDKQKLFFRFKWDFGGIRGSRRPFMSPAVEAAERAGGNLEQLLGRRLSIIKGVI